MVSNQKFENPIITPSTKADFGHDEDISKTDIIKNKILTQDQYEEIENITFKLFDRGSKIAKDRGLILVDTKYEFGYDNNGKLYLIDEIHTPDSSRYFYEEGYLERQQKGESQKQLSKEFVRRWLISQGFQGLVGQVIPEMDAARITSISERYIELYENITGTPFVKAPTENIQERIQQNVEAYFSKL